MGASVFVCNVTDINKIVMFCHELSTAGLKLYHVVLYKGIMEVRDFLNIIPKPAWHLPRDI